MATPEEKEALASNDRRAMEQYVRAESAAEKNKENDNEILNKEPEKVNQLLQP